MKKQEMKLMDEIEVIQIQKLELFGIFRPEN